MRKLKDNIKMDFQVIGWRILHWIDLAQGKDSCKVLVKVAINFQVPYN
jgi:hypothetical protein